MRLRRLGNTGLELTTVGLGTWAMGGPWKFGWGPQDDNEATKAILAALDEGINWIDTAPAYGLGHSEELIGKALKQTSHKPIIATKCGIVWDSSRETTTCLKRDSVRDECHNSLRRLNIDVIDLYQIHWPNPDEDIEQAWEEMLRLAEEGKIRYLGASNFSTEQLNRISRLSTPASLQPPYSMLHREVEDELLDYCSENNIGIIAYSPMQRGLLTGKFSDEHLEKLPSDDHRKQNPDFQQPRFGATLELVEQLHPIAKRNGKTLAQLAISWVLRRAEVTAAIVGARRPQQITETAPASDWDLNREDIEEIEQLLADFQAKLNEK